tara:strand:- start:508 stop:960 length:453 start_codon:yes stop_codon:yes gene_type:complete
MSLFNSPFLLGFDDFERTVDRISKLSSDSYPPYNIEQTSENTIQITVAVAGFDKQDLEINLEGNQLQIRGIKQENNNEKVFIHRGIATRQFIRNFILAEGIKVEGASMDNGLLFVDLSQPIVNDKSKKIIIKDGKTNTNKKLINLNLKND